MSNSYSHADGATPVHGHGSHAAGSPGHAHAHHPALQHHFDTMAQQREAATLGMWVFLLTEVLFFGGLFIAYTVYRMWYYEAFAQASKSIAISWGLFNTAVLIGSSLTMALAVRSAQTSKRQATVNWLLATIVLGSVFLGVKVIEYADKFEHHHVPGPSYVWSAAHEPAPDAAHEPAAAPAEGGHALTMGPDELQRTTQIFFSLYFTMTGLHALHMIVGIVILFIIAWMAHQGRFDSEWHSPVEMTGLYWHFVDIVWIFLFPLLYLVERHN